jgi:glycine/D-amino acid oxidase-like deaminating enzyme
MTVASSHPASSQRRWGEPPWRIAYQPKAIAQKLPARADYAVVGGGFTGLAAAAWLARLAPEATVVLLEAHQIGAGASGRTGGVVLGETAAGNLPGLGDVLGRFAAILEQLEIECDLELPGVWEIAHGDFRGDSPFRWQDHGELGVAAEVPGGTVDPGKLISGLARSAEQHGVQIAEQTPALAARFGATVALQTPRGTLEAGKVLFATDAESLELSGLAGRVQPCFTLAIATEPLTAEQLEVTGLAARKPFYTVDLPYLWGRLLKDNSAIFGSGLVFTEDWRELAAVDISQGDAAWLLGQLEQRVRGLHPALHQVCIRHRWGGPMSINPEWTPIFAPHPRSTNAIVIGSFCGHGVAQSVYFGAWTAEALLGRRALPQW